MYFKIKSYHLIKFILRIIIYIYYCVKTHYRQPRTIPRPAPRLAPLPKGAGLRQGSLVSNTTIIRDTHNAPILQTISAARLRDRRPDYLHFRKHRQPRTIPRPAPHLAPLPKGAGLRQGSLVSNTTIIRDTHNAPILQTISAARLRDRRPDYLHFRKHHQPRTTKIQILAEGAPQLFIIHNSLFIIHNSLPPPHLYHQCTISIPLVISIHGNYFHRIYYFCISHNIP